MNNVSVMISKNIHNRKKTNGHEQIENRGFWLQELRNGSESGYQWHEIEGE